MRSTLLFFVALLAALPTEGRTTDTDVAARVQVVFDPARGTVARRMVRVVDAFPGQGLEFDWQPEAGIAGLDAEGYATGEGVLTWRIPGTAAYDPRSVEMRFAGRLARGAPDGPGRMTRRDGSWRTGTWRAGRMTGQGRWMDAAGSLYEGTFAQGLPAGTGTLRAAGGWIYSGAFEGGVPHGAGRMHLPGGAEFAVRMERGRVAASDRPETPADDTLGGLMPVQGGGGEAGRTQLSVVTDGRVSLQQDVAYTHYTTADGIQLYPADETLLNVWSGNGKMRVPWHFYDYTAEDWRRTRAFLDVALATEDGGKVRLSGLELVADQSAPHLRPMLEPQRSEGCVGHRPWIDLRNFGWGPVQNPHLSVAFADPDSYDYDADAYANASRAFDVPLDGFDTGATLDLRGVLKEAGVDTATLSSNRFTCPGPDMLETCGENLLASVEFGELSGRVSVQRQAQTAVLGTLVYEWTDAWGQVQHVEETFDSWISLAELEFPNTMAEMGAGGAFATPAPEFQEIELKTQGTGYRVPIPVRGNPNLSSSTSYVQLFAAQSSYHALHFEAAFSDGSVRSSPAISFFYIAPRLVSHTSTITPGACFLTGAY